MIHNSVDSAQKEKQCGAAGDISQQDKVIKENLSIIKHKLFVMSGKGGVGKSSIASNLAANLAEKGFQVGLLDVDLHGPSIATMMGLKGLLNITEKQQMLPSQCGKNLKVISMQSLMKEEDQAVIWRGPAKTGMIKHFVGTVQWGKLDFLIIDAPPGTGDEPLTVVQTINDCKALIITTPQDVALSDVRKSINFCKTVKLQVLGLIENMGSFKCPCCSETISLFKSGGGKKTADQMNIDFLGTLPFDLKVVESCDDGEVITRKNKNSEFSLSLDSIIAKFLKKL